ncbi:hypothetical protein ACG83_10205 [Frankia sp. R43]|uniref:hypothetical protein n=1 Tax=Frankia sp. R43 TaxID=269536 RepID=UPI0006C9EF53|nr:hypothetical protein [Frankia sp. R43]KPM55654.1 hypothetical protein ACG83_10205 [Frankia sp. R43]
MAQPKKPAPTTPPVTSVDLANLSGLVGEYVHISRLPTPLEAEAYGSSPGFENMGGSGLVVAVHPEQTIQQSWRGETESLTGRQVDFDYGMGTFATADATVQVDHAAAISEFVVRAARAGQAVEDVLARALAEARRHSGLPFGTQLPDVREVTSLLRDLNAAVEFRIGDTSAHWIEGQPPPSVEVKPAGGGEWTVGRGRTLYGRTGAWVRDPEPTDDFYWPRDEALSVAHRLVAGEAAS